MAQLHADALMKIVTVSFGADMLHRSERSFLSMKLSLSISPPSRFKAFATEICARPLSSSLDESALNYQGGTRNRQKLSLTMSCSDWTLHR
jgi:hypothetical protein